MKYVSKYVIPSSSPISNSAKRRKPILESGRHSGDYGQRVMAA
jgi:hypothetical protein